MRFLFLITHYFPVVFGAELFAQKLAESLVDHGHDVDVVTGEWDDSLPLHEMINGVSIHRVRSPRIRYLQTLLFILPQLQFARHLHQEKHFDVVHAHIYPSLFNGFKVMGFGIRDSSNNDDNSSHTSKPVTRNSKPVTKTVVTIQGGDIGDYPEIYGPFGKLAEWIIGQAIGRYSVIHAVSTDLSNKIMTMTNRTAQVIPNGVDLVDVLPLKRSEFTKITTKYLAISPSRLTDKNNLFAVIDAIRILRNQNIDIGLVIAGSGHLEEKIKHYIHTTPLYRYIGVLGSVEHNRMLQLIKSADMVVRPSKQEGFGIALLEGMGLRVSVVATRNGGLADFVNDETAFVSGIDADSIARAMQQCLENQELAKKKAAAAYSLAQSYSWDTITARCRKELYGIS